MPERPTAEQHLATALEIIPRAALKPDGVPLDELARELGILKEDVIARLTEVGDRSFYLEAGAADDIQIYIESDQVSVWTKGQFRRPVRLSPRESLALSLGLRTLAAMADDSRREGLVALASRLERSLLDTRGGAAAAHFEVHPGALPAGGAHQVLLDAARDRRRCRISYLKPTADRPEDRQVDPYVVLVAGGHWYLLARCGRSDEVRIFRLDRVLHAEALDDPFPAPSDFDPRAFISEGRVFRADQFQEVTVRYSQRIARWVAERGPVDPMDDGSVLVRYSVADATWIVRHVLEHGPDAEVLAPEPVREQVAAALEAVLGFD
jgi:proteasome accessory factor C